MCLLFLLMVSHKSLFSIHLYSFFFCSSDLVISSSMFRVTDFLFSCLVTSAVKALCVNIYFCYCIAAELAFKNYFSLCWYSKFIHIVFLMSFSFFCMFSLSSMVRYLKRFNKSDVYASLGTASINVLCSFQ